MGGDDLDDDYAPDELVAHSDDGALDGDAPEEFAPLEGEEDQFVLDNDHDAEDQDDVEEAVLPRRVNADVRSESGRKSNAPKTPAASADVGESTGRPLTAEEEAKKEKKRKRRAKDNERKAKVRTLSLSHHLPSPSFLPTD